MTCLCISARHLLLGTSSPFFVLWSLETKIKRVSPRLHDSDWIVTALDITYDDEVIVVGLSNGVLGFYDCLGLKLLKNINKISISPILSVKFYHRTGRSIKQSKLITSDFDLMVYRGLFEKGIFGYDLEAQLLIEN